MLFYKLVRKLLDGISFCDLYVNELLDSCNTLIFWKDRNCNYLACNRKFAEIGGVISPLNIIGKSDYELVWRKEQSDNFTADDRAVMRLLCPKLNIIEPILQADGKETINLTSKFPIYSQDRKKFGLLGIITRIAEHKFLEQKIIDDSK